MISQNMQWIIGEYSLQAHCLDICPRQTTAYVQAQGHQSSGIENSCVLIMRCGKADRGLLSLEVFPGAGVCY